MARRMSSLPNSATKQRIDAHGFAVVPGALRQNEMDTLRADIDKTPLHRSRAGARHMLGNASVAALASDPRLLNIACRVLGGEARPFRATLFDKSPTSNWLVVWHQDTALPLLERHELPGWDHGPLRRALFMRTPQQRLWSKFSRCVFTSMNRVIEMGHYACFHH